MSRTTNKLSPEVRGRAVRLVLDTEARHPSRWQAVLPIAPPTCHEHLTKRAAPARRSDRAPQGEDLRPEIRRVFEGNRSAYGVRNVRHRSGHALEQVAGRPSPPPRT